MKRGTVQMKRSRMAKRNRNGHKEAQFKDVVRKRDAYQCQYPGCFTRNMSIDVHHIATRKRRPDLKFVQQNCVCLCRLHHIHVHSHQDEAIRMGLLSTDFYEMANHRRGSVVSETL
jgi:hypothetical protein